MGKRVLILTYDFPPYTSMGAQRPYGWYQYLTESGWHTTIVTRHWPSEYRDKIDYSRPCGNAVSIEHSPTGTVVRAPYSMNLRDRLLVKYGFERMVYARKVLTLFYSLFQYISFIFDNKSTIYFAAKEEMRHNKYDLIIATGEPFILFRYANILSSKTHTDWVADYRDCWSDNFEINHNGGFENWLHQNVFRRIETKLVNTARSITTAAPFFQQQLQQLFPTKKIDVVFNGYQDIAFVKQSFSPNNKFTIAFAGTIYPFQPLELFLEGLKLWIDQSNISDVAVYFYGANFIPAQKDRIRSYSPSLAKILHTTDRLGQKELFDSLQQADVLLLLDNKGMISGKLYEYLLMDKVILMAGRDHGSMEEILASTCTGVICPTAGDVAVQMGQLYDQWKSNGYIACNAKNIGNYSRKMQTHAFAGILNSLDQH